VSRIHCGLHLLNGTEFVVIVANSQRPPYTLKADDVATAAECEQPCLLRYVRAHIRIHAHTHTHTRTLTHTHTHTQRERETERERDRESYESYDLQYHVLLRQPDVTPICATGIDMIELNAPRLQMQPPGGGELQPVVGQLPASPVAQLAICCC
jgi:hypothetical protein